MPHQLADLIQHPAARPAGAPQEAEQFSEEKVVEGKVDWGLFGFMWQRLGRPGAILLALLLTLGQEGAAHRLSGSAARAEVSEVATLLGIYVLLGRAPCLHHGGVGHQLQTRPQAGLDPV